MLTKGTKGYNIGQMKKEKENTVQASLYDKNKRMALYIDIYICVKGRYFTNL